MYSKGNEVIVIKKVLSTLGKVILEIFLIPLVLVMALIVLIFIPFDYLFYKRTRFCKDTGKKYFFTASVADHVRLYNKIKAENLPIEYYPYEERRGLGYFICNNTLLIPDYPFYDEKQGGWFMTDDEYGKDAVPLLTAVEKELSECNRFFKEERCTKTVVFVYEFELKDYPGVETPLCKMIAQPAWRGMGTALRRAVEAQG